MVLARILVLVLSFAAGLGIIRYSEPIVRSFGHIDWAEKFFGAGGSYTVWKLGGVLVIIVGFLYAIGIFNVQPGDTLQFVPTN